MPRGNRHLLFKGDKGQKGKKTDDKIIAVMVNILSYFGHHLAHLVKGYP